MKLQQSLYHKLHSYNSLLSDCNQKYYFKNLYCSLYILNIDQKIANDLFMGLLSLLNCNSTQGKAISLNDIFRLEYILLTLFLIILFNIQLIVWNNYSYDNKVHGHQANHLYNQVLKVYISFIKSKHFTSFNVRLSICLV